MSIKNIDKSVLRTMTNKEGLILQGCGGDPQEWLDGINDLFKENGLLLDDTRFTDIYVFQNDNLTNILFPMDKDVHLDVGKLAMWRLQTHNTFGGTWLSDYVPNKLGGFITEEQQKAVKPDCELIGKDGNVFSIMGLAARTLRNNGMKEQASEMCDRVTQSNSYYEALNIIGEYVNITGDDEAFDEDYDFEQSM